MSTPPVRPLMTIHLTVFSVSHSHGCLQTFELEINGVPISLVIYTGAKASLLNEATYLKNFRRHTLQPANVTLVYLVSNQSKIPVLGSIDLTVTSARFFVVCHGTSILSLDLFHRLGFTVNSPWFAAVCTLNSMLHSVLPAMKGFVYRPRV